MAPGRFTAGFAVCAILYGGPPHVGSPFHMMLQFALNLIGGDETPPPTLNYFDARGRGEAIRLAFADNGVKFKENAFSSELWGKERDDGLKAIWTAAGRLPFGQVPLLTDGDYDTRGNWTSFELVQSHAILRYIGRRGSWDGLRYTPGYYESPDRRVLAAIDMAADGTEDVRKQLSAIKYAEEPDAAKHKKYRAWFTGEANAPRWLGFFDTMLSKSSTSFVAGTPTPSHADYLLFDLLDYHEACAAFEPALAADLLSATKMPALASWREIMRRRPGIAAYLKSDGRRAA